MKPTLPICLATLLLAAGTVFAETPTTPLAMPIPADNPQTAEKIELGKKLFFDRRLSGDGTMSCSTCHDPGQGFSDSLPASLSYPTTRNWRNSPTLFNVGLQRSLFHDGRAATLEEQVAGPIASPFEMNQNLQFLEEELRAVPEYRQAFTVVFGDDNTSLERIAKAIASFERTLVSSEAPADRFLRGDGSALSAAARQGYEVFTGKGGCLSCHPGPAYTDHGFHALRVEEHPEGKDDPRLAATRRFVAKTAGLADFAGLDADPGRELATGKRDDRGLFRTPTLRELSATAPYMHNGRYETLAEVVDFFDRGGGPGNTVLRPLGLDAAEKAALLAFLEEGLRSQQPPFVFPKIP